MSAIEASPEPLVEEMVVKFEIARKAYTGFMQNVLDFFGNDNSDLYKNGRFCVHSHKFRIKDPSHLREKISRKLRNGSEISSENVLNKINDFCGVRILHLKLSDFSTIHEAIKKHLEAGHWVLAEPPKAYTWDPEYQIFFENLSIDTEIKSSFYTSVHYVVKPNATSSVSCEIQVRTLFEEIWGEIDHELNYPVQSNNRSQREQLKVLAKLVGAGTKLIDSICES